MTYPTNLLKLLSSAQLPGLPQSAVRILELSQNAHNGPEQFAVPIESDPGLTGQVLRFVNSSYFGLRSEVQSVKVAISLVGIRTVKNFALWSAVFGLSPNPKCGEFQFTKLWQDSLRRGAFARQLARHLKSPEAEDLFAPALLQDMAIPILVRELPSEYSKLLKDRQAGRQRLSDLEFEHFGWTHGQAGGLMARGWKLPERMATLIERHSAGRDGSVSADTGIKIVVLSSMLPSACDDEWHEREEFENGFASLVTRNEVDIATIFAAIDAEFTEFAPILKLSNPGKPLVDFVTPAAELAESV